MGPLVNRRLVHFLISKAGLLVECVTRHSPASGPLLIQKALSASQKRRCPDGKLPDISEDGRCDWATKHLGCSTKYTPLTMLTLDQRWNPANPRHWPNVVLMLGLHQNNIGSMSRVCWERRLRRRANFEPQSGKTETEALVVLRHGLSLNSQSGEIFLYKPWRPKGY